MRVNYPKLPGRDVGDVCTWLRAESDKRTGPDAQMLRDAATKIETLSVLLREIGPWAPQGPFAPLKDIAWWVLLLTFIADIYFHVRRHS